MRIHWARPQRGAVAPLGAVVAALVLATSAAAASAGPSTVATPSRAEASLSSATGQLSTISCLPSMCMVLGARAAVPFALSLGPRGWRTLSPVVEGEEPIMNGVDCLTPAWCIGVGSTTLSSGAEVPISQLWDGKAWKALATPAPPHSKLGVLNSVSCTSKDFCLAVGSAVVHLLVETWNGSKWSLRSATSPSGTTQDAFESVSCTSPRFCAAVGSWANTSTGLPYLALSATWDGRTMVAVGGALPSGAAGGILEGASCNSARNCMAAGSSTNTAGLPTPLAESWDGRSWSVLSTSAVSGPNAYFVAISCPSSRSCMAIGESHNTLPLVGSWNGSKWALLAHPVTGSLTTLAALTCLAPNRCAIVGHYLVGSSAPLFFSASWNGKAWAVPASW